MRAVDTEHETVYTPIPPASAADKGGMMALIAAVPGAVEALAPKPSTRSKPRWDPSKHTNARAIARRKRQVAKGMLRVEEEGE